MSVYNGNDTYGLDQTWNGVPLSLINTYVEQGLVAFSETDLGSAHYDEQGRLFFRCSFCSVPRLGRLQELKRHVKHFHLNNWVCCPYAGCKKVLPVVRKDYQRKHLERVHEVRSQEQD
jgi:hypothetical protein